MNSKKIKMTALAALLIVPGAFGTLKAAEKTTSKVVLHKVMHKLDEKPVIENTGDVLGQLPEGVTPYDKAKYGDVEFTLYDVTNKFEDLKEETVNNFLKAIPEDLVEYKKGLVDEAGLATFDDVLIKDESAKLGYKIYLVKETKSSGLVNEKAEPFILALPLYDANGKDIKDETHIYPKNKVGSLSLELVKKSTDGTNLADAEFELYKGEPGSGTKVEDVVLKSNAEGKITIEDVAFGHYYLVETKAPEGHAIGKEALNDENNTLKFVVGEGDADVLNLTYENVKVPNNNSKKDITNLNKNNQPIYEFKDTIEYKVTLDVPAHIKDKTVGNIKYIGATKFAFEDTWNKDHLTNLRNVKLALDGNEIPSDKYQVVSEDGKFSIDLIQNDEMKDLLDTGKKLEITYSLDVKTENVKLVNEYKTVYANNPNKDFEHNGRKVAYPLKAEFVKQDNGVFGSGLLEDKLAGAEFVLIKKVDGEDTFLKEDHTWTKNIEEAKKFVSGDGENGTTKGSFAIDGLEEETYYLREVKAPKGYRQLANDIELTVTGEINNEDETVVTKVNGSTVLAVNNDKLPNVPFTGNERLVIVSAIAGVAMISVMGVVVYKRRKESQ